MREMILILNKQSIHWLLLVISVLLAMSLGIGEAIAAGTDLDCVSDAAYQTSASAGGGIVSAIMETIINVLGQTSETLYSAIIAPGGEFIAARNAAIMLVLAIYGVMIVFNIANFKPGEIFGLIFKIGLIVMITSPAGWQFFNDIVAQFFFGTMIELVEVFMGQAAGSGAGGFSAGLNLTTNQLTQPLEHLNWPLAKIISTQFLITVLGSAATGIFGLAIAIILVIGGFYFFWALINALFVYIKSIVGLWFLFALAPIFFLFLLFRRTQNLFEGWINMVLSFTLQPILLFAFLAFFITIVSESLGQLMNVNWCWGTLPAADGTSEGFPWWRPVNVNGTVIPEGVWGVAGHVIPGATGAASTRILFPLDLTDIMFFLISSYIALQYSQFVGKLAQELSSSGLRLNVNAEAGRNYFSSRGWSPDQIATRTFRAAKNWS